VLDTQLEAGVLQLAENFWQIEALDEVRRLREVAALQEI
jgi:hypothetical protein